MRRLPRLLALLAAAGLTACAVPSAPSRDTAGDDPFTWLEEVQGERPLAWVRERNAESAAVLGQRPGFAALEAKLLAVQNARDRIPQIARIGAHVYNFWTDEKNPRGLWRRTSLADYAEAQPRWETVLDVDALGKAEGRSWVWKGARCQPARTEAAMTRCIVGLSRGGSDASELREFDLATKSFVPDGFRLPEAKSWVEWIDADSLYVGTDFGPGSLTDSGYARIVKRWRRGTPVTAAETVFEVKPGDVWAGVAVDPSPGVDRHVFTRAIDFHRRERFVLREGRRAAGPPQGATAPSGGSDPHAVGERGGQLLPFEAPADALVSFRRDLLLLQLRSPYEVAGRRYPAGALLATGFDAFLRGERRFDVLFTPTPTRSLALGGVTFAGDRVLLSVLDNVAGRVVEWHREGGAWRDREVALPGRTGTAGFATLANSSLQDDPLADTWLLQYTDFLTPDSLYLAKAGSDAHRLLRRREPQFDATGMRVEQQWATSRDGTRVPYFIVWPAGARADGQRPTLIYGYGGFQVSMEPNYLTSAGPAWLAQGGVYVVANLRGGGEFGPDWHRAAIREHKQRSYDDLIAVAEDLVARGVTSPKHLGVRGGSNGGLLVGAAFTQRPDLFAGVVCSVPLLDMRRYHRLLAGASWMAEFGDPDNADDWAFMQRYSPYHQVRTGIKYPRVLFTTSTRDDRVHPAHARKMAARMQAQGHDFLYYENIEGGHGGAADAAQRAHLLALEYSYLWMQVGR